MSEQYILVIDEGTTGTRALIVDRASTIKAQAYTEFTQHHPAPDRVEHDALEIWEATQAMVARALEDAGAFSIILEAIPGPVAKLITERVSIPTIGIGAGPDCDGQVLVVHDLLGLFDRFVPKFVKQYASIFPAIRQALESYRDDVLSGAFPGPEHGYGMSDEALQALLEELGES